MKVYFISGLGANKKAFQFLDLSFCEPHFINWHTPGDNKTLQSYAKELFDDIKDEEAIIVGLSFGGMLATEIAKEHPKTKVIIISSSKTYKEIPAYLRFWKHLPVYKYFSNKSPKYAGGLLIKILGAKGTEQQKVQAEIVEGSDPVFTRWAMDVIVKWTNTSVPANVIHIHGTADKLLPYRYIKADHTLPGGEHLMIMDRADEISDLLKKLIVT